MPCDEQARHVDVVCFTTSDADRPVLPVDHHANESDADRAVQPAESHGIDIDTDSAVLPARSPPIADINNESGHKPVKACFGSGARPLSRTMCQGTVSDRGPAPC